MGTPRFGFDAVELGDGTVLVVGNDHDCAPGGAWPGSETAELYDPVGDEWSDVASLNKPRKLPATVTVRDGTALVVGGLNEDDLPFSSTKAFDPSDRSWSDGPLLDLARATPLAVTLADGRVLAVSTTGPNSSRTTSELLDPAGRAWVEGPRLLSTAIDHLVALTDGRVLAIGRNLLDTDWSPVAYLFEPRRDRWTAVSPPRRLAPAYAPVPDGGALAIGGSDGGELAGGDGSVVATVERFDPSSGQWSPVAPMAAPRIDPQVAALEDGRVLVAGGASWTASGPESALRSAEIYDPASDRWSPAGDLAAPRMGGIAVALSDGSALVLGGDEQFNTEGDTPFCPEPFTTVERFYPGR
jgi:hypothetical protein